MYLLPITLLDGNKSKSNDSLGVKRSYFFQFQVLMRYKKFYKALYKNLIISGSQYASSVSWEPLPAPSPGGWTPAPHRPSLPPHQQQREGDDAPTPHLLCAESQGTSRLGMVRSSLHMISSPWCQHRIQTRTSTVLGRIYIAISCMKIGAPVVSLDPVAPGPPWWENLYPLLGRLNST